MAQINPYLTFNGNCEGGKISMPMEQTFWGAYFGMFTSQFIFIECLIMMRRSPIAN
jgi:uncharacterized glyoxalase superfamily protein PhnB